MSRESEKTARGPLPAADSAKDVGAPPARTRRPYQPPRVRRLGSVRDLTLGSLGFFGDAQAGMQPAKM